MLAEKFEFSTQRRPIWAWLQLYLTPQRYHLNGIGSIISHYSGKEPVLVDQTQETGRNQA